MKTIRLLSFSIICSLQMQAQITITNSDMPHAGDTARYTNAVINPFINYGATGANHTWDFSNLRAASQGLEEFIDVSSTNIVYAVVFANIPFFPNRSNVSSNTTAFPTNPLVPLVNPYNFYYRNSSEYKQTGFGAEIAGLPVPITFNNRDVIYELPLNFGDSSTSNSDWNINIPGLGDLGYWQTRTNEVDGWGNLITPHATYNALRVKTTRAQKDTVALDTLAGFAVDRPLLREYKWLANGEIIPVMQITTSEIFGLEVVTNIFFRDDFIKIETNPLADAVYCAGSTLNVPYTKHGTFNGQGLFTAGNVFTAQLSDSSGSFANPINIGSVTFTQSGIINATIPTGTISGYHYRIRVASSNLAVEGSDNGTDLVIFNSTPVINGITASGSLTICAGGSVTLNTDTGIYYIYQWYNNSTVINGANSVSYTATAAGDYTVDVINICGTTTSAIITVTMPAAPTSIINTTNLFPCQGDTLLLNGITTDATNLQWQLNGIDITGAINAVLSVIADGDYNLVATGACGVVTSNTLTVTFVTAPLPATINGSGNNTCIGDSILLNATAGAGNLQWQLNGIDITGANADSLYAFASGDYTLITSNSCGSATSNIVTLSFTAAPPTPVFTSSSLSACAGDSILLTYSQVTGISFQWQLNGFDIPGTTNPLLYINTGGNYTLTATNTCGTAISLAATIIIHPIPTQPVISQSNDTLHSTPAAGYQWYYNGVLIAGANGIDFTPTTGGGYSVIITDSNGCTNTSASYNYSGTGIESLNMSAIHLYPNPVNSKLQLEWNQTQLLQSVIIQNTLGENVLSKANTNQEQKMSMDVSNLTSGIYFLQCIALNGTVTFKFVKQ